MGATATVTEVQDTKGGHFSTDSYTKAYGFKLWDKDGDGHKKGDRKEAVVMDPEKAEELDSQSLFEGSTVEVRVTYPSTFKGLMELANSPQKDDEGNVREQSDVQAEILRNFVAGSKIKVNNDLVAQLTKTDEKNNITFDEDKDTVEGVLDMTNSILRGSKRVFLTEEQKTWKNLSNLPAETRKAVFHAYLTATGKAIYTPED